MPTPDAITASQLSRLIGTPDCPLIVDVRTEEDVAADPRFLPTSIHRDYRTVASWSGEYAGRSVAVTCLRGGKLAQKGASVNSRKSKQAHTCSTARYRRIWLIAARMGERPLTRPRAGVQPVRRGQVLMPRSGPGRIRAPVGPSHRAGAISWASAAARDRPGRVLAHKCQCCRGRNPRAAGAAAPARRHGRAAPGATT